jgi:hypothetical protein
MSDFDWFFWLGLRRLQLSSDCIGISCAERVNIHFIDTVCIMEVTAEGRRCGRGRANTVLFRGDKVTFKL